MDQDSLSKWKEEFQNERQEQFSKVRQLQKDTQKRRKQMELKRKIDAAKEEQRRREALSERRAQHVEATMRFQKGIKNFRVSKGKKTKKKLFNFKKKIINLFFLEKISLEDALKSLNKRTSSADERFNSQNNTITSATSDAYSFLNRNKMNNFSIRSHLRRSSSFNDVNILMGNLNNNNNHPKVDEKQFFNNNEIKNYNNVISKPIEDTYKPIKSDNNNNNNNFTIPNTTTTTATSNFKIILDENQKTIQNFNKEALNDFKNTVMSEVKSTAYKDDRTTTPAVVLNDLKEKKDVITSSTDDFSLNEDVPLNEDLSSISSSDNLSNIEDSLEVADTLKVSKRRVQSASTIQMMKTVGDNNDKNSFNNQIANIKNHFLTKTLTTDFFSNSLLSNKKTYYTPQLNDNVLAKESPATVQRSNTNSCSKYQQNIKSILKRSSSDNNIHLTTTQKNPFVSFGIKVEKIEVKDSLEVARVKGNTVKEINLINRKKSVRFAPNDEEAEENDSQMGQEDYADNAEPLQTKCKLYSFEF
jgi:hypothetical protein